MQPVAFLGILLNLLGSSKESEVENKNNPKFLLFKISISWELPAQALYEYHSTLLPPPNLSQAPPS